LNKKRKWRDELDLIASPAIQELIQHLESNPMSVYFSLNRKKFRTDLRYQRERVSEAEAKVLWDLIHKYLMDGKLDLPDQKWEKQ